MFLYNSFHCRLCGEENLNGYRLYVNSNSNKIIDLNVDVINKYLPIKILDDKKYPNWICCGCCLQIEATVQFFNLIEIGQQKLNEKINNFEQKNARNQNQQQQISLLRNRRKQQENQRFEQIEEDENNVLMTDLIEKPNKNGSSKDDPLTLRISPVESNENRCWERDRTINNKRTIKAPERYTGVVDGEEYEKIFCDMYDDITQTEMENIKEKSENKTKNVKTKKKSDGNIIDFDFDETDIIGYAKCKSGENWGDLVITTNPNAKKSNNKIYFSNHHAYLHSRLKLLRFICDVCQLSFVHQIKFLEHCHSSHVNVHYECKDCLKIFDDKKLLIEHQLIETHNGNGIIEDFYKKSYENNRKRCEIQYICSKCNKEFSEKEDLVSHQLTHVTEKPYKCHVCGKRFKLKSILTAHITLHTGDKKFSCIICKQKFAHKRSLRLHQRIHEKSKPFQCDECGKYFTQYGNMQEHLRIHNNEKPYKCLICDKNFRTSSQHKKHIKRHDNQQQCNSNNKNNAKSSSNQNHCVECNKNFCDLQSLKKHLRIHTGEKPYKCFVCTKQFSDCSNFKKHQKIHLKTKKLPQTDNCDDDDDDDDDGLKLQQKNDNNELNDNLININFVDSP